MRVIEVEISNEIIDSTNWMVSVLGATAPVGSLHKIICDSLSDSYAERFGVRPINFVSVNAIPVSAIFHLADKDAVIFRLRMT